MSGRGRHIASGLMWSLTGHGFLLHTISNEAPYGWIRDINGNVIAKLDAYLISRSNLLMEGSFVTGYDKEFANSILVCNKQTGEVSLLKQNQEKVAGNQAAYLYRYVEGSGLYEETSVVVSWWHSASGDGPIHEVVNNHPFYPSSAIPSYTPYVREIDDNYYVDETDYYKVRLYYRDPDNVQYIIPPQLYLNGSLIYIHGDLEDPQGFFAGVHVISNTRLLAVYVSCRNKMGVFPHAGRILRQDIAELLDINIANKTVSNLGIVAQNEFFVEGKVRMTWPFRFNQSGTKVSNIQKMGNIITGLVVSPLINEHAYYYRDARFVVTNNILHNEENDSYSIEFDEYNSYVLDAYSDITDTVHVTNIGTPPNYTKKSTITRAISANLAGTIQIPYAINYIQNVLSCAFIKFSNLSYNYTYQSHETYLYYRVYIASYAADAWRRDKIILPAPPTLLLNNIEYQIYYPLFEYEEEEWATADYYEYHANEDSPRTTGIFNTELRSPPKLNISYINIIDNVLILTARAVSQEVYTSINSQIVYIYRFPEPDGVEYSGNTIIDTLKLNYFSVNDTIVIDDPNEIARIPSELIEVDSAYEEWLASENWSPQLQNALQGVALVSDWSDGEVINYSTVTNVQLDSYIGNSIYTSIKIATDSRLDNLGYIYKIDWPETDVVVDWGPPQVNETFAEIRQAGSNLTNFSSKISEIPGTSPSFDMIGII